MRHAGIRVDVTLHTGDGQSQQALRHSVLFEHVFNGGAYLVNVHNHHVVYAAFGNFERFFADLGHADAVSKRSICRWVSSRAVPLVTTVDN